MFLRFHRLPEDGFTTAILLFIARAASSMSANILGFTAAVWAITSAVPVSTFSSALQQGQVTSIVAGFFVFAILRIIPQTVCPRELCGHSSRPSR